MEEFLDELGIKHTRTILLWPRANGEVERQNTEGKPWQRELPPHTTTGISPAEILYGRKMRTKMPEFESADEEEERAGTTDLQARDQDAVRKQRGAENANKRSSDSDVSERYKVLLMKQRLDKLSATYDPEPYSVVSKRRDLVIIERGENLLKRNVGHVKRFIDPEPGASQSKQELHSRQSRHL